MEKDDLVKGELMAPEFDLEKQYTNYKGVLKNAVEGKVVTRFAPEPSGYLHIGHCKAALLSYHYAKMYKGSMILRFDDTNPSKEKMEFVEGIIEDLKVLGITYSKVSYVSSYFDKLHDMLEDLIKRGLAYVDNTPVEIMRDQRLKLIESECRAFPVEKNLDIFEQIKKGKADEFCIRAKIDMKSKNGCLRDPVLARTSRVPHHRVGTKYVLYPTYDFACPAIDSHEGVTHVTRSNEYADRIPQYQWMLKSLNLPNMEIFEYSRLNLEYTVLSKRKLAWFVDTKRVEGWNDPRFPTVRGCIRKGIRVETLTEFMLEQGPSKRANLMEWEKLWAINKRMIDPISPRYAAVSAQKACKITVVNGPKQPEAVTVLMSKLNPKLGERPVWRSSQILIEFDDAETLIEVGKKVTLMNWGNFMITGKTLQEDGSYAITAEFLAEDQDFKSTKKITWLASDSNLLTVTLTEYDHLIKTPKVDEDVKIQDIVNVKSCFPTTAFVDSHVRTLNEGQYIQIERRGYYKIDKVWKEDDNLQYNLIFVPDGKKVGLASIAKTTDKKGDIQKKDLTQKVEEKQNKQQKAKKDKKKKKEENEGKEEKKVEEKEEKKVEEKEVPAEAVKASEKAESKPQGEKQAE